MAYLEEIVAEALSPLLNGINTDRELLKEINRKMDKTGIYYRSFARVKSPDSLAEKLNRKDAEYREKNKKLQDIVGIRIVLYFDDDIPLCRKIIEDSFEVREEDSQVDKPETSEFKPERMNLICELPEEYIRGFNDSLWQDYRVDKTFELQIRTIFSEGWHEVEHDIRYKHEAEWKAQEYYDFNRELNGIKATLEMSDKFIVYIIERLTYYCYKNDKTEEMLRYKFRIHLEDSRLSEGLKGVLDRNLRKELYKAQREKVLMCFSDKLLSDMPKTLDNLVYVCNALLIHNEKIRDMTPRVVKEYVDRYLENGEKKG